MSKNENSGDSYTKNPAANKNTSVVNHQNLGITATVLSNQGAPSNLRVAVLPGSCVPKSSSLDAFSVVSRSDPMSVAHVFRQVYHSIM